MAALHFPEALHQGHATFFEVMRGEAIILSSCVILGILGYCLALMVLRVCAVFAKDLRFLVIHEASMAVGIAFAAVIQLYRIPFLLSRPSDLAAILGICLALLALAFGLGTAVRIVRRSVPSPETH
jgi:hypothetical protein